VPEPTGFVVKKGSKTFGIIPFIQKYATIVREFKDGDMKVNYTKKIEAKASELKIILSEQRTITRSTKNSNTLLVEIRIYPLRYRCN
jgi:hypothetical protein